MDSAVPADIGAIMASGQTGGEQQPGDKPVRWDKLCDVLRCSVPKEGRFCEGLGCSDHGPGKRKAKSHPPQLNLGASLCAVWWTEVRRFRSRSKMLVRVGEFLTRDHRGSNSECRCCTHRQCHRRPVSYTRSSVVVVWLPATCYLLP